MSTSVKKGLRRRPDLDTLYTINADGSRNVLQPAEAHGRWHTRRTVVFAVLIAILVAVPWIRIGGAPALLLDIPARTAYIAGSTFTREDFYLVFFLLTGFGFALFAVTSVWGRVWCGYACPQTVFLEGVFRRVESWIEGSRNERLRRQHGPWTFDKVWRKAAKQFVFLLLALFVAHTALAYFIPTNELLPALLAGPEGHWTAFAWTIGLAALLYFDFAWFREQFCVIVCPYGRLQSALIDDDTLSVGYDARRGEPRGPKAQAAGDCIDCGSCVSVCPTGIDIRNGLQMECVGCTNCIDACDSIMRQVGRAEGLVRYDSLRGFRGEGRRWLRPRLFVYAFLALVGAGVFAFTALQRTSFDVTVLRARGLPYTLTDETIENLFTIHVQNKSNAAASYRIEPESAVGAASRIEWKVGADTLELGALAEAKVPVFAHVDRREYHGPAPTHLRVTDLQTGEARRVELVFRGP